MAPAAALTNHKLVNYVRRETRLKRGGGEVRGESVFLDPATHSAAARGLDQVVCHEPTPEMLVALEEQNRHLLALLPDNIFRQIAVSRLQGDSNEEIASQLQLSVRSVERKLNRIREYWQREFDRVAQQERHEK